jgi:hypothetical protein
MFLLFKEIIAICAENQTKRINKSLKLLTVVAAGIFHWALKG